MFKEKTFDILVHLASIRESSCNEGKTISRSCSSVLSFFLFSSCDEKLMRFIVIGLSSAIDTGYSYVYDYLFTAPVRITNENIGSMIIVRFEVGKRNYSFINKLAS